MTTKAVPAALDRDVCYRALQTRDARFDGRFYTAVVTTGVYCRPVCPARTPKLENCVFVRNAGAAQGLGFRPCLRCRPELAPTIAGGRGTANTVSRALQLIAEGALDGADVDGFAERLGVGARHLRRLFDEHVGASPVAIAQAHRILFAKKLIGETSLSMADIALGAGFGSIRRFNDVMQRTYQRAPSALRATRARSADLESPAAPRERGIVLKLPFSPPYDWPAIASFLAARAVPGVEVVGSERYQRAFAIGDVEGDIDVRPVPGAGHLRAIIRLGDVSALPTVVARLRGLFDLDADIRAIDEHLARDPLFVSDVAARPGVRVPGAWDPFELAVRAVLGQRLTVVAATTIAGRLVAAYGRPLAGGAPASLVDPAGPRRLFPEPAVVAAADLAGLGLTGARAATLRALGGAVAAVPGLLRSRATLGETIDGLAHLPGIGPSTAQYIAMRALREPDAFPASDLGLLRALGERTDEAPRSARSARPTPAELTARAEAWRPWRAYAAMRLWMTTRGRALPFTRVGRRPTARSERLA